MNTKLLFLIMAIMALSVTIIPVYANHPTDWRDAPTNLRAADTRDNKILFTWSAPASSVEPIHHYTIQYHVIPDYVDTTITTTDTSYWITGLTPDTAYEVFVFAHDFIDDEGSRVAHITANTFTSMDKFPRLLHIEQHPTDTYIGWEWLVQPLGKEIKDYTLHVFDDAFAFNEVYTTNNTYYSFPTDTITNNTGMNFRIHGNLVDGPSYLSPLEHFKILKR